MSSHIDSLIINPPSIIVLRYYLVFISLCFISMYFISNIVIMNIILNVSYIYI